MFHDSKFSQTTTKPCACINSIMTFGWFNHLDEFGDPKIHGKQNPFVGAFRPVGIELSHLHRFLMQFPVHFKVDSGKGWVFFCIKYLPQNGTRTNVWVTMQGMFYFLHLPFLPQSWFSGKFWTPKWKETIPFSAAPVVLSNVFYFHPDPWGVLIQFDLRIFFNWVGSTTN